MPHLPAILSRFRCPLLADILHARAAALIIAAAGAAQVFASLHGIGLPCPFHDHTGLPCPGCGLTRSIISLLHGNLTDSLAWHPYGILLALALLCAALAALLPTSPRTRLLNAIAAIERTTGITSFALLLLPLFWIIRLTGLLPLNAA